MAGLVWLGLLLISLRYFGLVWRGRSRRTFRKQGGWEGVLRSLFWGVDSLGCSHTLVAIGLDGSGPFGGTFTDLIGEYCRPGPYLAIWYPDFLATPNCRLPLQNTPDKLNYILP